MKRNWQGVWPLLQLLINRGRYYYKNRDCKTLQTIFVYCLLFLYWDRILSLLGWQPLPAPYEPWDGGTEPLTKQSYCSFPKGTTKFESPAESIQREQRYKDGTRDRPHVPKGREQPNWEGDRESDLANMVTDIQANSESNSDTQQVTGERATWRAEPLGWGPQQGRVTCSSPSTFPADALKNDDKIVSVFCGSEVEPRVSC